MEESDSLYIEIIVKYLDQSAGKEEMEELLNWLKADKENRKTFDELKDIWYSSKAAIGNDIETEIALEKLHEHIRLKIDEKKQRKQRRHKTFIASGIAASLLIILSLVFFTDHQSISDQKEIVMMNRVIAPSGTKVDVVLPDGSHVWLDSSSELTYPESFAEGQRTVSVTGKAFFNVVKDSLSPFTVNTKKMMITVLGTSFEVSDFNQENIAETTLRTGKIKVKLEGLDQTLILKPDEKLSYSGKENNFKIEPVNAQVLSIWANKEFRVENQTLAEIIPSLEQWYKIKIDCPDDLAQKTKVDFVVTDETKEQLFKVLAIVAPIRYTINENHISIQNK